MLTRAFIAMILSAALALGALFAASTYLVFDIEQPVGLPADGDSASVEREEFDNGVEEGFDPDEGMGEPPIALPDEAQADLAGWLASVLAEETSVAWRFSYDDEAAEAQFVDLAALAQQAAQPQPVEPAAPQQNDYWEAYIAECQSSHVTVFCSIGVSSKNWADEYEGEVVAFESYDGYRFYLETNMDGQWVLVPDSVERILAG